MYEMYEPAGEDEEGACNITVSEEMSIDDVKNLVLKTIAKILKKHYGHSKYARFTDQFCRK